MAKAKKKSKGAAKAARMVKVPGRASLRQREVEREDISYNKKKAGWLLGAQQRSPHRRPAERRRGLPPVLGGSRSEVETVRLRLAA
jgi:hypothetical protein